MSATGRDGKRDAKMRELLAAHATGGLAPQEAAEVEAYLAAHPEARAELDDIAGALAALREAALRPSGEPDWDAMAAEIRRACAEHRPPPRGRLGRRLGAVRRALTLSGGPGAGWRPARPAVFAATMAAGAALAIVVVFAISRPDRAPVSPATGAAPIARGSAEDVDPRLEPDVDDAGDTLADDPDAEPDDVRAADQPYPELREPVLGDLSGEELERLEHALAREERPADAFVADLLGASLDAPSADDRIAGATDDRDDDRDESPAIDPFQPPDYLSADDMADELPDEALDAIDRFLAEVQAG
jgi:hypothetical protein